VDAVEAIGDVVKAGYRDVKKLIKGYVDLLQPKNWYNGTEKHHIVAKKDYRAWISRKILEKYGIGIDSEKNLVSMKKGYHRVVHTNLYYLLLNSSMIIGSNIGGENGVNKVLSIFKKILGGL